VGVEGRRCLEGLAARAAGEGALARVNGPVDDEVTAVHERPAAHFTDVPPHVGRVTPSMCSQQCGRPVAPLTHLDQQTSVRLELCTVYKATETN